MKDVEHNPRYIFDCENCKFSWCCGYCCSCSLRRLGLPEPPDKVKIAVNKEQAEWRKERGLRHMPEFPEVERTEDV